SAPARGAVGDEESAPVATAAGAASVVSLRRGLPRVAGGDAWPPASTASGAAPTSTAAASAPVAASSAAPAATATPATGSSPVAEPAPAVSAPVAAPTASSAEGASLRRGLPRIAGGDPWPPAGAARVRTASPQPLQESMAQVAEPVTDTTQPAAQAE